MQITATALPDVLCITPDRHQDARGFFSESWNSAALRRAGVDIDFVQDNHSFSTRAGVVRGLHFQAPPFDQDKLVRCGRGPCLMWPLMPASAAPPTDLGLVRC